jgi:hypothetical protein
MRDGRDFDLDIDAIEQQAADLAEIALDNGGGCSGIRGWNRHKNRRGAGSCHKSLQA